MCLYVYGTLSVGEEAVRKLAVPVVVLQTIAANLGSMLTPIGNPQNLYLYGKIQMSPDCIYKADAAVFSGVTALLLICTAVAAKNTVALRSQRCGRGVAGRRCRAGNGKMAEDILPVFLSDIILLCLLTVAHMIPYPVTLGIVALVVGILRPRDS